MQVEVRDSIDKAMAILKRKLRAEGVFFALERHAKHLKPGERRRLKHSRHLARKTRSRIRQAAAKARRQS